MQILLKIVLLAAASTSPLLTFTWLWQLKEWRVDRLKEHLRAEGWFRQLFGWIRPVIVLAGITGITIVPTAERIIVTATLATLAAITFIQIIRGRQRFPVWTGKAVILIAGSALITLGFGYELLVISDWLLVILPLLQPLALLIAWTVFLPIDKRMKDCIMDKATRLRGKYANATVIGITGSVGKTTTKELLAHLLAGRKVLATPAYVNSEMGVSKWMIKELPKLESETPLIMIVEMGAYCIGEIARLCTITQPSLGVITFIGSQHLALFGSQQRLCQAKGELLEYLPESGHAFLNGDSNLCAGLRDRCNCPVTIVGTSGHADLEAFDIEEAGSGVRFSINNARFEIPLHGTHNVTNVLLAIAVAQKIGMPMGEIAQRLRSFTPPHNTFSVRKEHGITILDDTHNASSSSFRAAIAWAKSQPAKRKILLTPGLIELGTDEGRIHRELGAQAKGIFHRVIFTTTHNRTSFGEGFGTDPEILSKRSVKIQPDDLLVCVGRVSDTSIKHLLP